MRIEIAHESIEKVLDEIKNGKIKLYLYPGGGTYPGSAKDRKEIKLEIANSIEHRAKELVREYYEINPTDARAPSSVGYAALYASCMLNGYYLPIADIFKVTGKSANAIREAYKALKKFLNIEEPL